MDYNCIVRPAVPYFGELSQGLTVGRTLLINGFVPSHCYRFTIDFVCCSRRKCDVNSDVAFHASVRLDQRRVALNTFLDDKWLKEESDPSNFPVAHGRDVDIIITTEETHYNVVINGRHLAEFKHRLPIHAVKAVHIQGEIQINKISYHSLYAPKLNNTCLRCACPVLPSLLPAYKPALPYNQVFPYGLKHMEIAIYGKSTSLAHRFAIDFMMGKSDIAMHFNVRYDQQKVVMNSRLNDSWKSEVLGSMIFDVFVDFVLNITVKNDVFYFTYNGQYVGVFKHRITPISRITSICVQGDLIVSSIQYT